MLVVVFNSHLKVWFASMQLFGGMESWAEPVALALRLGQPRVGGNLHNEYL